MSGDTFIATSMALSAAEDYLEFLSLYQHGRRPVRPEDVGGRVRGESAFSGRE